MSYFGLSRDELQHSCMVLYGFHSCFNGQMRIPDHEGILKVKTGVVITGKGSPMKKA